MPLSNVSKIVGPFAMRLDDNLYLLRLWVILLIGSN